MFLTGFRVKRTQTYVAEDQPLISEPAVWSFQHLGSQEGEGRKAFPAT